MGMGSTSVPIIQDLVGACNVVSFCENSSLTDLIFEEVMCCVSTCWV